MDAHVTSGLIEHVASVLRMFSIEPRPLDQLVALYFRKHRSLSSRLRREIADAVFGVMRYRSRLDGLLSLNGVSKIRERDRVKAFLEYGGDIPAGLDASHFSGGDAQLHAFPAFLYRHLIDQYGDGGAKAVAEIFNTPQYPTLRVNTLRLDRDTAIARLRSEGVDAEPTERSPFGVRLSERKSPDAIRCLRPGDFAFQDESSQLAALLSSCQEGEHVLDACAGAGGKSLALAMLMNNRGSILSVDVDARKLEKLKQRAKLEDVRIIETRTAEQLDAHLYKSFDLVFVDAPCSGSGTLRRSPDIKWRTHEETIAARCQQQATLLAHYSRFVRPGGRLLYATCSIFREENEEIVKRLLTRDNFQQLDAAEVFSQRGLKSEGIVSREGFLRTDPRYGDWDGFFGALMRREKE